MILMTVMGGGSAEEVSVALQEVVAYLGYARRRHQNDGDGIFLVASVR